MNKLFVCIVVLAVVAFAAVLHGQSSREPFSTVGVDGFAALADSSGVQLVDVRTDAEYSEGHLPGAMLIDVKSAGLTAWPLPGSTVAAWWQCIAAAAGAVPTPRAGWLHRATGW